MSSALAGHAILDGRALRFQLGPPSLQAGQLRCARILGRLLAFPRARSSSFCRSLSRRPCRSTNCLSVLRVKRSIASASTWLLAHSAPAVRM